MTGTRSTCALCLLAGIWLAGCQDELPSQSAGQRIVGTVSYAGEEADDYGEVTVRVSAFPFWPPMGPPIALQEHVNPSLSADDPQPFELKFLGTESTYFVVAQLLDSTAPPQPPNSLPLGSYPNTCALGRDEGRIAVLEDAPVEDIGIEVFDEGGSADPCAPELCPDPGLGSLFVEVGSAETINAEDQLLVILFPSWPPPPGPPVAAEVVAGESVQFPQGVLLANVPAGPHALLVCLDRGSDSLMGCSGDDISAPYRSGEQIDIQADVITALSIQLEDGSGEPIEAPQDCSP